MRQVARASPIAPLKAMTEWKDTLLINPAVSQSPTHFTVSVFLTDRVDSPFANQHTKTQDTPLASFQALFKQGYLLEKNNQARACVHLSLLCPTVWQR